jgi:hypothetical protein
VKNNGYLTEIKKVWILKENVYQQTKDKSFKEYTEIMNKEISELQRRFKDKYVKNETNKNVNQNEIIDSANNVTPR